MDEITILHNFCKQKAVLEIIVTAAIRRIDILQFRKARTNPACAVDRDERIPRPVTVGLIASDSVSIVETLNDFWAKDVDSVLDVEASFLIKGDLISWRRWVDRGIGGRGVCDPCKDFRSDPRERARIGVFAAIDEGETEIDVLLLFENHTTE